MLGVLVLAEEYLRHKGCPSPRLDAQVLLAHVLAVDRLGLYLNYDRPLSESELAAFRELIRRRAGREPVAYITGEKEFWSLPFVVDPRVLIPRPDSETLIEIALVLFQEKPPARFADVGTGSGCLACALARLFPTVRGVATDREEDALGVARKNAIRLGLAERISFLQGDLLTPLPNERFDLIVANLPYIPSDAIASLDPEVWRFEPRQALDGGPDGLALIRRLASQAPAGLLPGGWLLLEVGQGQADSVLGCCKDAGFRETNLGKDLAGIDRVVAARK